MSREPQELIRIASLLRMGEGRAEVVPIRSEATNPGRLVDSTLLSFRGLGKTDEIREVAVSERLAFRHRQLVQGELADRLEHGKPRFSTRVGGDSQDTLFDKVTEVLEELRPSLRVGPIRYDRRGSRKGATSDKDRQTGKEVLFLE